MDSSTTSRRAPAARSRLRLVGVGLAALATAALAFVLPRGGTPSAGRAASVGAERAHVGGAPRRVPHPSKPPSRIGSVEAVVVERPAPDRAVVEATWRRSEPDAPYTLFLVLPEGAFLVDGEAATSLRAAIPMGTERWEIGFPTGHALDAVVRLTSRVAEPTPEASGELATETAVRLTDDVPVEPEAPPDEAR